MPGFLRLYRKNKIVDYTPDNIVFSRKDNVAVNSLIESDLVQITGINVAIPISLSNGEYWDGSTWKTSGFINPKQIIKVRTQSSTSSGVETTCTITLSNRITSFTVKTAVQILSVVPSFASTTFIEGTNSDIASSINGTTTTGKAIYLGKPIPNDGRWYYFEGEIVAGTSATCMIMIISNSSTGTHVGTYINTYVGMITRWYAPLGLYIYGLVNASGAINNAGITQINGSAGGIWAGAGFSGATTKRSTRILVNGSNQRFRPDTMSLTTVGYRAQCVPIGDA